MTSFRLFQTKKKLQMTILQTRVCSRLFQTERVCRLQFQIDENGNKLSKWVENTVEKGEIACYKQFLHLQEHFQKTCTADT